MNVYRSIALWLMMAWMIGLPAAATAAAPTPRQPAELSVGQLAPDFNLTLFNGKKVSLKSFRGKSVLMVFWRSG